MIRFIHILFTIGILPTIAAPGAPSWSLDLQRCENRVEVRAMGLPDIMHIMGNSKPLPHLILR